MSTVKGKGCDPYITTSAAIAPVTPSACVLIFQKRVMNWTTSELAA